MYPTQLNIKILATLPDGEDEDKDDDEICVDRPALLAGVCIFGGGGRQGGGKEVVRKDRAREPTKRSLNSDETLFPNTF